MKTCKEVRTPFPGIFKILVLGKDGKWSEPARGKRFKARRYEKNADGTLTRVKRSFESLAEAKLFRNGAPLENDTSSAPASASTAVVGKSSMTFHELIECWCQNWLPSIDLATQLRYRKYLRHFEYFRGMQVADIQPAHIDAWITHLKRPEYLASCHPTRCTYEHEFKVLRAILGYYSTRCDRNYRLPFLRDHLKMLKVREKPPQRKDLTVDQLRSFLLELRALCCGTKWEAIYYLAVMQYAIYGRIQEAAALHVEDFDLQADRLEVKRKVQWLRARGYADRVVAGSKANGGKVFKPIPELAVQVLKEWLLRSGIRSGLLFRIDGEVITYRQIQHKYDHALSKAGLPFRATHILRHAALTEAYSTCLDILAVQKLAGHKGLRATERYAKVRDDKMVEVQRRMDEKTSSIWR